MNNIAESLQSLLMMTTGGGPSWMWMDQQPAALAALAALATLAALACSTLYWMTSNTNAIRRPIPPGYKRIPHLRSWIPFIGSAVEFQRGHIRDFIKRSAAQLQAPAFTATVMGDTCLFIADSDLLNFIFRESKQLDGLTFQKRFLRNVTGFTNAQIEVLFDDSSGTPKRVMHLFHKHLLQDDALERTLRISQDILLKEVDKLVLGDSENIVDGWTRQHLFNFASTAVFRASAGPVLSMNLIPNHEEYIENLRKFEKGLGLLFVGAPNFMAPDCVRARAALISLFMSDLVLSAESPFLQERRETLTKGLGDTKEFKDNLNFTIARNNLGVFLASVGNSIQAIFWTLLNLMENPEAYEACTEAVKKVAAKREGGREWFTLEELDELMVLQSAFHEALRMYQALFVTRQAVEDFCLNPKETKGPKYMVEKGTTIMVLPNSMHMDPEIFENPETFQYDRFLDPQATSKKGTKLSSHLRPFGGGVHLCPGRKFIGYEARAILAMILLKYDMRLRPGETNVSPPQIQHPAMTSRSRS
jgi:cytochrome P450